jgi:hypothetical protein
VPALQREAIFEEGDQKTPQRRELERYVLGGNRAGTAGELKSFVAEAAQPQTRAD